MRGTVAALLIGTKPRIRNRRGPYKGGSRCISYVVMPVLRFCFILPISHLPWQTFRSLPRRSMTRGSSPRCSDSSQDGSSEQGLRERRVSTPANLVFEDVDFAVGCDTIDSFMVHGKTKNVEVVETYSYKMVKEGAMVEYAVRYTPTSGCFPYITTRLRLYLHARRHAAEMKKMCAERSRSRTSMYCGPY